MNKRIAIFTTTRGDMAIIAPLIKVLKKDQNISLYFFVGGTHDKKTYGETVKEIEDLNIKIDGYFNSRNSYNNDDPLSLSILLSKDQIKLANIFKENNFEYVCLVGDRYEKMAIVMNAILFKKKIIHIHGGEITLGSFDNQIRNMFSNASELHFVICDKYKKNLINMNIDKKKIHNIGSLAIENLVNLKKTSASLVLEKFNLKKKNFCILNYHPPSLDIKIKFEKQITNVLKALSQFNNQVLITTPGLDSGRNDVIKVINKIKKKNKKIIYIKSLGFQNFFKLIPFSKFVIGNSSSGIIEVPYFKIPSIDIGLRQFGRYKHPSVISCDYKISSIKKAIRRAMSQKFKNKLKKMKFIFKNGIASEKFIKILKSHN
jgi:UDP-hydrolysing UDP-N-acetyl-D-glucosamine 2-epimerase